MTLKDLVATVFPGSPSQCVGSKSNMMIATGLKFQTSPTGRWVRLVDFWDWAEQHRSLVDFSAFPEGAIGKEPDWVKAQRVRDLADIGKSNKYKRWTDREDRRLINLIDSGYSMAEIEGVLGRSETSIRVHLTKICSDKKPERSIYQYGIEWPEIKQMVSEGYSIQTISQHIGRSEGSVRGAIKRHCGTSAIDKARQIILRGEDK